MHFLGVYLCHLGATWESLEPSVPSLFVRHVSGGEEPHRSWTHPYLAEAPLSPGVRVPLSGASLSDPGTRFSHNTSSLRGSLSLQADCHTYGSVSPLLHPIYRSVSLPFPLCQPVCSRTRSLSLSPPCCFQVPLVILTIRYTRIKKKANKIKRYHANTTHY